MKKRLNMFKILFIFIGNIGIGSFIFILSQYIFSGGTNLLFLALSIILLIVSLNILIVGNLEDTYI